MANKNDTKPTCVIVWSEKQAWYVALGNNQKPVSDVNNFYGNERGAKEFANWFGKYSKLPVILL